MLHKCYKVVLSQVKLSERDWHLKKFIFGAFIILFILIPLIVFNTNSAWAQEEDYVVTVGEGRVFTSCNLHNTETIPALYHPTQGNPSIMVATSDDQLASTHILANAYQEGSSQGWVGVVFAVEENEYGGQAMLADVSITFDYSLNVDFQVPPPSESGGGSAGAAVGGTIAGNFEAVDQISFVHNSDSASRSGTETLTQRLLLQAGNNYVVFLNVNSYGDVYIGGYADSQCSATVTEVRVKFFNLNVIPEVPLGTAVGLSSMMVALSLLLGLRKLGKK
jgi:hypothetical protein